MKLSMTAVPLARAGLRCQARLALAVALGLTAAGCGQGDGSAAEETKPEDTASAVATVPPPDAGGAATGEVVTLRELTPGDRACYVRFDDVQGKQQTGEAAFELCEQKDIVGRQVRLRRERTTIASSRCQGDPECAQQDTVELIVAAEPIP